jgi:hypothetical protein
MLYSRMRKAQQAADFIMSHCPNVGAFWGAGEPYGFLQGTAQEMLASAATSVFPSRYIEHVAYAVDIVGRNRFLSPPAAVASVYLATRFEFYFRVLSGRLHNDGRWVSQSAQQVAVAVIGDKPALRKRHVSNVAFAYKVMKLGTSRVVSYCAALDRALYNSPTQAGGHFEIADLGDRIAYGRHRVAHGHWGDISADAVFYGLLTAVVFYSH